ncbi:MAG: hypothetical protein ACOY0T_04335 [Myxococcota bacterium]
MEFNRQLLQEIRKMAAHGAAPSRLLRVIVDRLNMPQAESRLHVVAYFREGFHLSLADAMSVGASCVFPDGNRADGDLDIEMRALIMATQHLWREQ